MRTGTSWKLLQAAIFGGLCISELSATPIAGVFNIAGTITVTANTISWQSNNLPFPPDIATVGPGPTGSFSALGGTDITISDLHRATEPIGSLFADQPFIAFNAEPTLPSLLINFIYPGIYSSADCATLPPQVGQVCTPFPPNSPFSFVNNPPPAPGGPQATATFVFTGESADHLSLWRGNFTSQFSVPYQTVLAAFGPGGSGVVENTFSGTITVVGTPEPGTFVPAGFGAALAFSLVRRKRRA